MVKQFLAVPILFLLILPAGCDSESVGTVDDGGNIPTGDGTTSGAGDGGAMPSCLEGQEVLQPGTTLCWLRCPGGQAWNGGYCVGQPTSSSWDWAMQLCEELGGGYRLPTKQETEALLGGCIYPGGPMGRPVECRPCSQSQSCSQMFPGDTGYYWTASVDTLGSSSWDCNFESGVIDTGANTNPLTHRCLRDLAP